MRVLQVITLSELGGAQSVVINLSNHLSAIHEVLVVAGEGDGKLFDLLDNKVKFIKLNSLVRRLSPINEFKAAFELKKIYNEFMPDVVHLHSSKAGLLGRIVFPRSKVLYTVHGFDSIRIAYRKFLPLEKLMQYRCSSIVGVSSYDKNVMHQEGIKKNVTYIYNGIYEPISLGKNPFVFANEYSKKILCIARVSKQKKLDLFIDIARRFSNYAFIWIGNTTFPNMEFPPNVFFLGSIANAGAYIAYADLFLLTSNYEGLPMVIIESLAKGVPVVASNVGGIPELLNGKNGWAVDNKMEIFASKIESFFKLSREKREEMSIEAKKTYERTFTVEAMVNNYLKLYCEIINKRSI